MNQRNQIFLDIVKNVYLDRKFSKICIGKMYQIKIVLVICFVRNDKLPCCFVRKMAVNITSFLLMKKLLTVEKRGNGNIINRNRVMKMDYIISISGCVTRKAYIGEFHRYTSRCSN